MKTIIEFKEFCEAQWALDEGRVVELHLLPDTLRMLTTDLMEMKVNGVVKSANVGLMLTSLTNPVTDDQVPIQITNDFAVVRFRRRRSWWQRGFGPKWGPWEETRVPL